MTMDAVFNQMADTLLDMFGVPAVFMPAGGPALPVTVLFSGAMQVQADGSTTTSGLVFNLEIRKADLGALADPARGDGFEILEGEYAGMYVVDDTPGNDGVFIKCVLGVAP